MSKQETKDNQNQKDDIPDYNEDSDQEGKQEKADNQAQGNVTAYQNSWKDYMLKEEILRCVNQAGFSNPSPVQNQCLVHAINGSDILCQAKAGTGKTAVFVLSILNQLEKDQGPFQALVLCHTRELAIQIYKEFERFGKDLSFNFQYIIGKVPLQEQVTEIKKRPPHVVVGTPGRVLELVMQKQIDLNKLRFFVLDECDNALSNIQMRNDIQQIFKRSKQKKQVMMFSGTMPDEIKDTCRLFMKKPIEVIVDDHSKLVLHGLLQYQCNLTEKQKVDKLMNILKNISYNQVIIFTSPVTNPVGKDKLNSTDRTKHLSKILEEKSFKNIPMYGNLPQEERKKNMDFFKEGTRRILISTDLCSRGLDIPKVNMVINFDMPDSKETYMHRIGRAGRFETKGLAISFVVDNEQKQLIQSVEKDCQFSIPELPQGIEEINEKIKEK